MCIYVQHACCDTCIARMAHVSCPVKQTPISKAFSLKRWFTLMCWNLFFEERVASLIEVPQSNIFVTKCSSRHRYQRVLVPCFNVKPSCFPGFPYKVGCSATEMRVEMAKPADVKRVYLEHLKNYPGEHGLEVSRYSLA